MVLAEQSCELFWKGKEELGIGCDVIRIVVAQHRGAKKAEYCCG